MMKKLLFAGALLSLALASGCAKGGSGPCVQNCPAINITDTSNGIINVPQAPVGVSITFTAAFQNAQQTALNWTITGSSCTGNGNPCGSFSGTPTGLTATYTAPATVPSNPSIDIVATSQTDSTLSGSFPITIEDINTDVAPTTVNVGIGLTQQFTAVAVPDNSPQQFNWSCTAGGVACVNFGACANGVAGTMCYKAVASEKCGNCVHISAIAPSDPNSCVNGGCTIGKATVVSSRLTGNSSVSVPFAFRFSGYDKNGSPIAVAGTFTVSNTGSISGFEDEITSSGLAQHSFSGGSYTPSSDPNSSNNAGTLSLPTGIFPNTYQVVLDGAGDIQMIASDVAGNNGSGVAVASANNQFNQGTNQTFAFGFTGVDSGGKRVGSVGLMATDGNGTVASGSMDVNDNGTSSNCLPSSSPACSLTGTYTQDPTYPVMWHLTLTAPITAHFDFFIANGAASANNPLAIYAISTDPVDAQHPAVLGTMTYQNPSPGKSGQNYNNTVFNGTSVAALAGVTSGQNNVSLTLGTTDGNGNFSGQFDQNSAGTILASIQFPPVTGTNNYTYTADSSGDGRYTFNMLGNPSANPVVAPLPFILYASGVNQGFLLDQSSSAVMTGLMVPQPGKIVGLFAASNLPNTFALATNSNSDPSIASSAYLASNLLLTSPGNLVYNVNGTQNPGAQTVTGTYSLNLAAGNGAIVLTAPAAKNYVMYMIDFTHFFMIDETETGTPKMGVSSPLFFAEE